MTTPSVLAIDQGTTSTRALVYDAAGHSIGSAGRELTQHYPQPGWVEHDAEEIWATVADVVPRALADARIEAAQLTAIGLTNQRETVLLWERDSGRPVTPAIVWQDRRTSDFCQSRRSEEDWLRQRTGLILDPYFSATKIRWLLNEDVALRRRAESGQLACGTIDSFLLWRLTGGRVHATDRTNASRTLLFNIHTASWDEDLCRFFETPRCLLPQVRASMDDFGQTGELSFLPAGLPITGVAGDQQAALFGQCAFQPGQAKCTYGTGAFFLQHLGDRPILSRHRLLTTVAASDAETLQYALEGSVFIAGAAVQWLRDGLKLFGEATEVEALAERSDAGQPVVLVPGFVGLGAPHWAPKARGVLFGLTRGTSAADLGRAALEGVAYQVGDLIDAAGRDAGERLHSLRVDGGMARNAWFLQCQADILGLPILQAPVSEATALGAAYLAGLRSGVWSSEQQLCGLGSEPRRFEPRLPAAERERRLRLWHRAVQAVIAFYAEE